MRYRHRSQRVFGPEQLDPRLRHGLVGHWIAGAAGPFDYSGRGQYATGAPRYSTGPKADLAFDFDGAGGGLLDVAHAADLSLAGSKFAIAFWVWIRATGSYMLLKKYPGASGGADWALYSASESLSMYQGAGFAGTGVTLPVSRWAHVAIVGDKTAGTGQAYLDGIPAASTFGMPAWATGTDLLRFGQEAGAYYLNGRLADVRLYDRALSGAEVAALAAPVPLVLPSGRRRIYYELPPVTPDPSDVALDVVAPTVTLGSVTVPPAPSDVVLDTVAPSVGFSSHTVTPSPSDVVLDTVAPDVLTIASTPTADLLAAVEAGRYVWLHEVDLPDGTILRSSVGGYSSTVTGHYEARIEALEGWRIGWSDDGVAAPEMHVELADPAGVLAALLRGRYQRQLEAGVACRLLLAPLDASGTRLLAWSGVTVRPEITATNVVRFGGRVDDRALRVPTPRRLLGPSWPYADAEVRELPGPAVYGLHDGGALGLEAGQVPALLADDLAHVYIAAGGAADSVIRVYDGATQVATAGYAAAVVTRKGWAWQAITFTAAPSGDVTVDMNGAEDVGDGSGALITNPVEQLAHYLSNRVLAQATGSAWLANSARLDAASLATLTAWITTRLYGSEGTSYFRGDTAEAYSVLREWQESLEVRAWWQADGTLAFGVWPHDDDPYFDTLVARWASHDLTGNWAPRAEDRDLAPGLRARYVPRAASGGYLATLDVLDPEAERSEVDELPMPWSCAG